MKRLLLTLFTLVCAVALCACSGSEKESFGNVDHDKDGKIIFEEAFFVFPDLTPKRFAGYDANGDGSLDLDEYVVLYASETARAEEPKPGDAAAAAQEAAPQIREQPATPVQEPANAAPAATPAASGEPEAPPITNEDLISASIVPAPEEAAPKAQEPEKAPEPQTPVVTEAPKAEKPDLGPTMERPETYAVAKGDILIKIAQKFNLTVEDILKANPGLNPDAIREGQKLRIPAN